MRINNRYNLKELANRIAAAKTGPDRFDAFEIRNVQSVLESCVDFNPQVPYIDRRKVVWDSIVAASRTDSITEETLTKCLSDAERTYLQTPLKPFILASSITLSPRFPQRRFYVGGSTIILSTSLPNHFSLKSVESVISNYTKIERPGALIAVRVSVRARTHVGAVSTALEQLDVVRGILNFALNEQVILSTGWPQRPVNPILLGPIHTLHNPSGRLATKNIWYEPGHQQFDYKDNPSINWDKAIRWYQLTRRLLRDIPYEEDLRYLFVRYCRALDNVQFDVAFNKLWAVFEHLGDKVGDYAKLIDRVLFLYADDEREYARLILEHLRDVRNGLVHSDRDREEIRSYTYQLKWFVENLFRYHLSRGWRYSSLKGATAFLDNSRDIKLLQARIREYRDIIKFLR